MESPNQEIAHFKRVAAIADVDVERFFEPTHHHFLTTGRRLHAVTWGEPHKPAILFLHGGNQTARTWDIVCLALSRNYFCVALDQRGHGDSEWSYEFDYGPAAHCQDIEATIQFFDLDRLVIVGMSMGCLNGLYYACTASQLPRAFVAVDAGPYVDLSGGERIAHFVQKAGQGTSFEDYVDQALLFNSRRDRRLLEHSLRHGLRENVDGTWTWKADHRRPLDLDRMAQNLETLSGVIHRLSCPTLILQGEQSDVFSDAHAKAFADDIPNGVCVTIPQSGHTIQGDNPKALISEVARFIDKLG